MRLPSWGFPPFMRALACRRWRRPIAETTSLALIAVADVMLERAVDVSRRFGAAASADPLEVVRRDDIDLVVVATPPNRHAEITLAALSAGKHVLCEKLLAHTLA